MAAALGIKQPTVSEWLRGERQVPAERCLDIERLTRLRAADAADLKPVLCEELRPDLDWGVVRKNGNANLAAAIDNGGN